LKSSKIGGNLKQRKSSKCIGVY